MSFFAISALINFITAVGALIFVLLSNKKDKSNRFFAMLSLSIALWALFYFLWQIASNEKQALFFTRLLTVFAHFIPLFYFYWLINILHIKRNRVINFILGAGYFLIAILIAFAFSPLLVSGVAPAMYFEYWPIAGPLHILAIGVYGVFISMSFYLLVERMIANTSVSEGMRLKYVFMGSFIGFAGGLTNFFLWYGIEIPPFGNIFVSFYSLTLLYITTKYTSLNIKLVFIKTMVILLNVLAVAALFMATTTTELIIKTAFVIMVLLLTYFLHRSFSGIATQKESLKEMSQELRRSNEELKRLDKAKSGFILIASHQLRTPLTAIKGYISLILEGTYGKISPEVENALNKVFLANERIVQLVEELLNITKLESGALEYEYANNVQVEEILEELGDIFSLRAKEKKLDFKIELPDKKSPSIRADKSKLREVISNLIDNAIKYTKEGFVHVSVQYDEEFVRVIVRDSGVGISQESLKSLFSKFSRGTDSTKLYTEGTGLGLYVGKKLIEEQGGKIHVKSDGPNKGSEFIVEMPVSN